MNQSNPESPTKRRGSSAASRKAYDAAVVAARKEFPHLAGKLENHYILPKYLGGDPKGPTVKIDRAYHQKITNEFRKKYAYGQGRPPSAAQRERFMREVYEKFPLPPSE